MIWIPTWDAVKNEWTYTAKKPAAPVPIPAERSLGPDPFTMTIRRNKPLAGDHKGVVAVGESVRRMR